MPVILGNDDFILYFRKQHPHAGAATNGWLGRWVWTGLRNNDPTARIVQ